MSSIIFGTTNQNKLAEAKEMLEMNVEGVELPIDEIQNLDSVEVAKKKAQTYYSELNKPLFVEDVSLSFEALNGLPAAYINDFSKVLGNSGLISILSGKENRNAEAKTVLVYIDEKGDEHIFEGIVKGTISTEERGNNGFGWDPIFIPEGETKTFAEMTNEEKNRYSMRGIALQKMSEFLKSRLA